MSVFSESIQLDKFFEILSMDPDKVCYGKKSCDYAMQNQAVETLLISDKLFRAKNIAVRKAYVDMVEDAEKNGVSTVIFSSMNPSGESKHSTLSYIAFRVGQFVRCSCYFKVPTPGNR